MIPFVIPYSPKYGVIKLGTTPIIKDDRLKDFIFTRRLSSVIGKNLLGKDQQHSDTDYIQAGRDYLDKNRYKRSYDAHRKLVEIFGGKGAKVILSVDDEGGNIDQAMQLVAGLDK